MPSPDSHDYQSALDWANRNKSSGSKKSSSDSEGINWIWVILFLIVFALIIWWSIGGMSSAPEQTGEPTGDRMEDMKRNAQLPSSN